MADMRPQDEISNRISADLRRRGGNFVGPTIVYAFMQATGMINDHLVDRHRHDVGQTKGEEIFSVAQHSVFVEWLFGLLAPDALRSARLAALLHDAPEYVIGDMISPFNAAVGLAYKQVESRLQIAVHMRFGLPGHT